MPPSPQPSSNPHALSTSNPGASSSTPDFKFPPYHVSYPPFFTLQPTVTTRLAQLHKWSLLIQRYCAHYRLFRLSITSAATLDSPLFHNVRLRKRMSAAHVRAVFAWMAGKDGGNRAEWIGGNEEGGNVWVFWRRPEEWAEVLSGWVEEMGQKNTVLTLYELIHGEMTASQEFHGMDPEILQRSLNVLVKRGKAQVFGSEDQQGVKFF